MKSAGNLYYNLKNINNKENLSKRINTVHYSTPALVSKN
jgi:hypothetical protein